MYRNLSLYDISFHPYQVEAPYLDFLNRAKVKAYLSFLLRFLISFLYHYIENNMIFKPHFKTHVLYIDFTMIKTEQKTNSNLLPKGTA